MPDINIEPPNNVQHPKNEHSSTTTQPSKTAQPKKHSLLANLGFNILIPTIILSKLSGDNYLGPVYSVVVALAFPIFYGVRDYLSAHKPNFFSILGVISVIMTGGMSLLKLPPEYIAIKEATIPSLLGLATLISIYTRYPLVRTFLYNDQILQVEKISASLRENQTTADFERHLKIASYLVAGSFFLSGTLNYALAKIILVSAPGTTEFAEELGKMTALSFPIIALPCTLVLAGTLYYLLSNIQKLTRLSLDEIMQEQ